MPDITIRDYLTSLGFYYPSSLYKSVKSDITAFLRASVDLLWASDETIRMTADRYLATVAVNNASDFWNSDIDLRFRWGTEEGRVDMQTKICDVMKLMQKNAIDFLHRKSDPCPGCRTHPPPAAEAAAPAPVHQPTLPNLTPRLPRVQSDVGLDGIGAGFAPPRQRLSSQDTATHSRLSSHDSAAASPPPYPDDPNDSDYAFPERSGKRKARATPTSRARTRLPPGDGKEKTGADRQGTASTEPKPQVTRVGVINPPQSPSHARVPQPTAPQPTVPESAAPQSATPQSATPQSTVSQPTVPRSTDHQSTAPESAIPHSATTQLPVDTDASASPSFIELLGRRWVFETAARKAKALAAAKARQLSMLESLVREKGEDNEATRPLMCMLSYNSKALDLLFKQSGGDKEAEALMSAVTHQLNLGESLLEEMYGEDKPFLHGRIWEFDIQTQKCLFENGGRPVR